MLKLTISDKSVKMPEDNSRRSSLSMRLFKSKSSSRKNSIDSTYSSGSSVTNVTPRTSIDEGSFKRFLRKTSTSSSTPSSAVQTKQGPFLATSTELNSAEAAKRGRKPRSGFPSVDVAGAYQRDEQTGEQVVDHTDLLHSLVHGDSTDTLPQHAFKNADDGKTQSGEEIVSKLPLKIWEEVLSNLSLADTTSLSFSCKAFRDELRSHEEILNLPENLDQKIGFLLRLDGTLPNHLFCFNCNVYHRRLDPGKETLKATNIANPVFNCPHSSNPDKRVSRVRISSGRALPFTHVQLVFRTQKYGPSYGIPLDTLSRRYKETNVNLNNNNFWSHQTRYCMVNGHLLVRVISQTFAAGGLPPAGLRNLLYNPSERFNPYFSTCPHWRDGLLMPLVKCAVNHIPAPVLAGGLEKVGQNLVNRFAHQSPIVTLCEECRPMRRCPTCPTEYLIEIKMSEDRMEKDPTKLFKQALMVTRWSDLGDGSIPCPSATLPYSKEWVANTEHITDFDSFAVLGKRAISGVFESQFNKDLIPGQRILNLNPNKETRGEAGHDWY